MACPVVEKAEYFITVMCFQTLKISHYPQDSKKISSFLTRGLLHDLSLPILVNLESDNNTPLTSENYFNTMHWEFLLLRFLIRLNI